MIINQATSQESQVTTLPEPSAALAGKIVQLVGNPPATYTTEDLYVESESDAPEISAEDYAALVASIIADPTRVWETTFNAPDEDDEDIEHHTKWRIMAYVNGDDGPEVGATAYKTPAEMTAAGFSSLQVEGSFFIDGTIVVIPSPYTKGYFYECTNEAEYTITNLTYTPYPQGLIVTPTVESDADFIRLITDYIGVSDPTQVSYITVRMTPNDLEFVAYDAEDNQLGSNEGMGQGQLEDEYHIIVESEGGLEEDQGWNWNVTITGSGETYRWKQKDVQFGFGKLPQEDGSYYPRLDIVDGVPTWYWDVN